ncbi:hypothetical protein K402DRAFT_358367 [Aulographum hederae CBS 113979]|uniref:Xylanolytic transcriptional activator regulatory domain-containing protein n=1 Tax=Aulographum hederae CBS 113979 TaxID=1176131 RepID=A0A6G1GV67_9PEZI|nr:hypothetical protein K402DRAFT_358367 [Aulographum hederae CBS 113979]
MYSSAHAQAAHSRDEQSEHDHVGSFDPEPDPSAFAELTESLHAAQPTLSDAHFHFPGTWTSSGLMDFGAQSNLELDDIDYAFLADYNNTLPFNFETPMSSMQLDTAFIDDQNIQKENTPSSEFFRTPALRYNPSPHDHAGAEQANLFLPTSGDSHNSPESRVRLDRRTTTEKLDQQCRDKIMAMVLSTCKATVFRSMSVFPSVELLDSLYQLFLTSPLSEAESWLHIPTFHIAAKDRIELLLAAVSAGAVLVPDKTIQKLGYALQEAVRQLFAESIEANNSLVRYLPLLQAYMLNLDIQIWSGNSRKMEVAESFQQTILTMLRRGGRFRRSIYPSIHPHPEEHGEKLAQTWKNWVEQQSWIRLIFHAFKLTSEISMAFLTPPLISYAELFLPVPDSADLWTAPDAESWKTIMLSRSDTGVPRLSTIDCLNNLDILNSADHFDKGIAAASTLYSVWGLVWEYRQQSSAFQSPSSDSTILAPRYQELSRRLQYFRISFDHLPKTKYKARLSVNLELILMHLHLSLEDMQLFAGQEGQEEAARVRSSLKAWAKTESSRMALWYAGQVTRAAKSLPKNTLRDMSAIAIYHAAIALWSYPAILKAEAQDDPFAEQQRLRTSRPKGETPVRLDGPETPDVQRFTAFQRGLPAVERMNSLQTGPDPAYLNDPNAVIEAIVEIVQTNHTESTGIKPPLVENLVKLMQCLVAKQDTSV